MGQKASDFQTVPLCRLHHKEHRYALDRGRRQFEHHFQINLNDVIARLTAKPRIRIINGKYVALLEGFPVEIYNVGPLSIGVKTAILRTMVFFREQYVLNYALRKPNLLQMGKGRRTGIAAAE